MASYGPTSQYSPAALQSKLAAAQAPQAPVQQAGGGFSIFGWQPHIPNLGGVTAIKQFASGITGLVEMPFKIASGEESIGDAAGGLAKGFGEGALNLAATAGRVVGIPGTDISLEKPIQQLGSSLIPGFKAENAFTRPGGPIAGLVSDALTAATFAAPVAGSLGKAADAAAISEGTLAKAADAAEAAGSPTAEAARAAATDASARAAELAQQAKVAGHFAKPFGYLMDQLAQIPRAAALEVHPPVGEELAQAARPADLVDQTAAAVEHHPTPTPEETQAVTDAIKTSQNPVTAAATTAEGVPLDEAGAVKTKPEPVAAGEVTPTKPSTFGSPEEAGQINQTVDEAQAAQRKSSIAENEARKLLQPPPAWAQRLAKALPNSVDRVLSYIAQPINSHIIHSVSRDLGRLTEVSQRAARNSPGVTAGVQAATQVLDALPKTTGFNVSHIVGEEITARLTGTALSDALIKETMGNAAPELTAAMSDVARLHYPGLSPEMRKALSPEQAQAFDAAIEQATTAYREANVHTFNTLLSSHYGAQGLEQAILGDDSPMMTPAQVKMYRGAMRQLRMEQKLRERIPDAESARQAVAERAGLDSQKAVQDAEVARQKVGIAERTAESYRVGTPKGLANLDKTIADLKDGVVAGGSTYHVGRGETVHPSEGFQVGIAPQFDVPMEQFMAQADTLIGKAVASPQTVDGLDYGTSIWNGEDARLTVEPHVGQDGSTYVRGTITMNTWGGKPLDQWQATMLGEAYKQDTVGSLADGSQIAMTMQPEVQNLMAHYVNDILDPKSELNRFARQVSKAAKDTAVTAEDIDAHMRFWTTWDYSLSRSNPDAWKQGDYFKAISADFGKRAPNLPNLMQTVLHLADTQEGVDRALGAMEPAQVSEALKWYYDSHDYVEKMWGDKTITLLNGEVRPAKEVFYDLLAVTSVMASPKQNLGRALSALSNMDEFLSSRRNAMAAAQKLMVRLDKVKPGVGKDYALKFENIPEVRRLTEQTSMVTSPKYNVMDILTGRLKLDEATNADIGSLPEYWTGNGKSLSDTNLDPQSVIETLDRNGVHTPESEQYRQAVAAHRELAMHKDTLNNREFAPITKSQNEDTGTGLNQSRQVTPHEFEQLAQEGKQILADKTKAASEPTALSDENFAALAHDLYQKVQPEWGGETLDTHTGVAVDPQADAYSVTARPQGAKAISVPIGASEAVFAKALRKAIDTFKPQLSMEGAHLGVFHNVETGKIEIDPAQVLTDQHQVEAVGAASHAAGGAYHFKSGLGYWVPYVGDEFATKASFGRAVKASSQGVSDLLHSPSVEPHFQRALMEHHGSNALAKLRSFRQNLADPHNSLAVTLDSVMARMYGISSQDWAGGNTYGKYANQIREAADMLSKRIGRQVMPHEIQALLWVYTKQEVGRMDWGRLLDHHDFGYQQLDHMQQLLDSGVKINPEGFDPLGDYYNEELQLSEEAQADRARANLIRKSIDSNTATEGDIAELKQLEDRIANYKVPQRSTVSIKPDRADVASVPNESGVFQDRYAIPFDAKKLAMRQESYGKYVAVRDDMQAALRSGDIPEAKRLLTSYVVGLKRSIMGDVGGSFQVVGEETRNAPKDVAFQAEQAISGRHVPKPEPWDGGNYDLRGNMDELHQRFADTVRGATVMPNEIGARMTMRLFKDAGLDTLTHEGAHLLRQMLPEREMDWVRSRYPHITDTRLTAARRVSEEAFVTDLMMYIRGVVHNGADAGAASSAFQRIAATAEEQFSSFLDTAHGRSTPPDIQAFWQRMFHPNIEAPDVFSDPIGAQRVAPAGVEVKQFNWETPAEFAQRARQYGEARQAIETARVRAQQAAQRAAKVDSATRRMWASLQSPTLTELRADALHARAYDTLSKLGAQLEVPSTGRVPAAWQPLWRSFQDLHAAAKEDATGTLAAMMSEVPENFSQALQFAAERGFDPTHVQDLTWEQAQRYLFGHIQLHSTDEASSLRRTREGVLSRNMLADHSLEALGAGNVAAMREVNVGQLTSWVEQVYSRPFDGTKMAVPEGWVSWDRSRTRLLSGTDREGLVRAPTTTRIIPAGVDKALNSMEKNYDNWAFHLVTRVTSPWRTLIMTFSPSWYLKHATGNIVLASAEGVSIRDWLKSWHQWKDHTLPEDVRSIHSFAQSTQAEGASSLIPRSPRQALDAEGFKAARHAVQQRTFVINNAINEMSRAAVYNHSLRMGATTEAALTRAYKALGDYGDLTAFERSAVRAVVPFYSFQKSMLKLVMRFPTDHPLATEAMMLLGKMHQEQMEDKLGGPIPDAYFGLADLGPLGTRNIGFINPFRDASNLLTPSGIAQSFNPYLDLFLRQAYNAPASSATASLGYGPTGKLTQVQDPTAALADMIRGLPQARLAQTALTGADALGNQKGLLGAAAQYLGEPKQYTPTDLTRIANNIRKAQIGQQAQWYPGFNAPKGTPSSQTPEAFTAAKVAAGTAGQTGAASTPLSATSPNATPKAKAPKLTKAKRPRLSKTRLKPRHLAALKRLR